MSHLLNFISSFGSSAELRQLPAAELTSRMQQAGLTPTEIAVLHSGDHKAIARLMQSQDNLVCMIVMPETPVSNRQAV